MAKRKAEKQTPEKEKEKAKKIKPGAPKENSFAAVSKMIAKLEPKRQSKDPFCFRPPFRLGVFGPSGRGKTSWIVYYLTYCPVEDVESVLWVTPPGSASQPKFEILKEKFGEHIKFIDYDRKEISKYLAWCKENGVSGLIVLDDLMHMAEDPFILRLFASARHAGVSVIEITQLIFPKGAKGHRNNSEVYVCYPFAEKNDFTLLASKITSTPEKKRQLISVFDNISTRENPGCLIIDFASKSTKESPLRVRDTSLDCLVPSLWSL